MKCVGTGLFLLLVAPALHAQRDSVVIHGTIVDRSTGAPVAGAYVALWADEAAPGWTVADSLGQFTLSPWVRGRQRLLIECPRPRGVWGETLDTVLIDLHPRLDTAFTVMVANARCNLPPFADRQLDLAGFYSLGFEDNRFFPDPDSLGHPIIWGGNILSRHAAVSWSAKGRAQRPPWPSHPGVVASSYCYRVHWIGTLTGPGDPPGTVISVRIAAFTFVVDSTISVEPAPASKCAPQH